MLIGRRINDRYKIIKMIGGGGMANVYLAHDMILDRDVAIKILRLDFANEDELIRRFQREAQSATSLTHENIVSIYDVGEENDIYYIVMEYVDGMTLKQYIHHYHPIPLEKTIDIMKQLTSAVFHAHNNHIIHRDIKPQNILIDHHGHVMITDFGIAMALSATAITQTNSVLGSVHYLSPEQARGGMATKKSDIYSLGIVMFELLTGRLPFSGESAISIALKHLQSDTPLPSKWNPDIPQSVENIVLKATTKDPFLRYESAEEMERDLETALEPSRLNEPKFEPPEDNEITKAIPVIKETGRPIPNDQTDKPKNQPSPQHNQENKVKKKKRWPWIAGGLIVIPALILLFFIVLLPIIRDAQNITIPDVRGKEYDDAVEMLVDKGLVVGEKIETTSEEYDEGEVIKTDPKAGRVVKKGSSVDLVISSGKDTFTLSDYTGRQYDEIVTLLDNEGFKNISKKDIYSDEPAGTIIEQSPEPNSPVVPEDSKIIFTVSMGNETITLRDLSEYNKKGLETYAESTGLDIEINEDYSDHIPEGLVISQSPAAGTELTKGDQVSVVISKGKEKIPPQTVIKQVTIPYQPEEEGQPQEIKILIEDMNNTMTVPADTFTIDKTIEKDLEFTIEKGKKAGYKIVRDNTVILEGEVDYSEE